MKIKTVNIIGAGKVGSAFIKLLDRSDIQIKTVMTTRDMNINCEQKFKVVSAIEELDAKVDINIICVKDDVISELIKNIPKEIAVVHTSGSVPFSVFEGFEKSGVLYPLQTFSEEREVDLNSCYFLLESKGDFQLDLKVFCETYFSKRTLFCDSVQRSKIHLSAVFANNFINHLLLCSKEILEAENIDFKILEPLVLETVSKSFDLGPLAAQTGPALRNDVQTIERHITLLKDENLKNIYKLLTASIRSKID